ncbi:MAG: type IV toxin-antitoxin system AbiEi family antitoxin domain-containing protein [Pseudomonadota bacterium]
MKPAAPPSTQRDRVMSRLRTQGMARLSELIASGATAATVSRLERDGLIVRLTRGLYQLADAPLDANQSLAEAAKLVPKGVVCLTSALAFHGLTDQIPARIWMAIGTKDWRPRASYPPMRFARFDFARLKSDVETHRIDGVAVPVFGIARTIADLFRYRKTVGLNIALEGLREALRQKKVKPAEIARQATKAEVWRSVEPYLAALTSDA